MSHRVPVRLQFQTRLQVIKSVADLCIPTCCYIICHWLEWLYQLNEALSPQFLFNIRSKDNMSLEEYLHLASAHGICTLSNYEMGLIQQPQHILESVYREARQYRLPSYKCIRHMEDVKTALSLGRGVVVRISPLMDSCAWIDGYTHDSVSLVDAYGQTSSLFWSDLTVVDQMWTTTESLPASAASKPSMFVPSAENVCIDIPPRELRNNGSSDLFLLILVMVMTAVIILFLLIGRYLRKRRRRLGQVQ